MISKNKRFNISLDRETEQCVDILAKHKKQSKSATIAFLIREGLEQQEDIALEKIVRERMKNHDGKWLNAEEVWGK